MNGLYALDVARAKAQEIVKVLEPHCERLPNGQAGPPGSWRAGIEIAGSIRRGKLWVKDIDLVAIPKMESKEALFDSVSNLAKTDFCRALQGVLYSFTSEGQRMLRGPAPMAGRPSIMVDVYAATAESWATLLLIRTGSAEHNIWMCGRARACGGKLHADGSGLEVPGQYDPFAQCVVNNQVIRAKTEEEIFKAMGIPYAEPGARECVNARPMWMRGETA